MFRKTEVQLIALSDLDTARDALRQAAEEGPAEERPGLRRALEILDGLTAEDPRRRWVRRVLAERGVDPRANEVAAIKALRDEVPGLSLVAATELAKEAKEELAA